MSTDQPTDINNLAELLKKHPHDQLIFGGYICLTCTPEDADDPDQNVYWPCSALVEAGMTESMAGTYLIGYSLAVDEIHRLNREQIAHANAGRDHALAKLAEAEENQRELSKDWAATVRQMQTEINELSRART